MQVFFYSSLTVMILIVIYVISKNVLQVGFYRKINTIISQHIKNHKYTNGVYHLELNLKEYAMSIQ